MHRMGDDGRTVREDLHRLVDDVEPRSDALPRLLAKTRKRKPFVGFVRAVSACGALAGVTALVAGVLVFVQGQQYDATPVSVRPNSYLAQPEPGVVASFDISSGRQIRQLATLRGEAAGRLAADGQRVITSVSESDHAKLVEITPDGQQRTIRSVSDASGKHVFAAAAGRVAYVENDAVVIVDGRGERRVRVPDGFRVIDLALDGRGRLAVLADPNAGTAPAVPETIYVVDPGAQAIELQESVPMVGRCGPLAVTWSDGVLATVLPVECSSTEVRVATFDWNTGQQIAAGVPVDIGARPSAVDIGLSADRLGRFLLSTSHSRQWVVDGAEVRSVPPACAPDGACARGPGTFWG